MSFVRGFLLSLLLLLGGIAFASAAGAQDDTGYTVEGGTDGDAGYAEGGPDAEVLGTSLARTGTNVLFLTLIGGAAIAVGVGLDRWSGRLEADV